MMKTTSRADTSSLSPLRAARPTHPALYADTSEQLKHLHNIERLAEEIDRPIHEIEPIYKNILTHLKDKADVQDYLPILVSKKIKHIFKNMHSQPTHSYRLL